MSHTMVMVIENSSSQVLQLASASHSWDGNSNSVAVSNLAQGATSSGETITSGYTQSDDYSIQVTYADGSTFHTKFSCNSSYGQTGVTIQICNGYCNCIYTKDGGAVTGCYNKG